MQRDKVIDVAKGIAMLLVIAGHCQYVDSFFKNFIYSFHMPLFFFLSGLVFSCNKYPTFVSFVKNKVKSLLLPYFSLGTIVLVFRNLSKVYLFKTVDSSFFFKYSIFEFNGLIVGNRLHDEYYGFWFVLTLFLAIILFYFIVRVIDKMKYKNYLLISIAVISYLIQLVMFKYVKGFIWSLDLVPIAISFISLGYLVKLNITKIKPKISNFNIYTYIMIIVCLILSDANCRYYIMPDIFYCQIGNTVIFAITSLIGIYLVLTISNKIGNSKILEYIGRNTYTYYMFHSMFVFGITDYIIYKICNDMNIILSKNVTFWTHMYITCIILYVISFVINKYLPFLYGKRRVYEKREKTNSLNNC